MKIGLLVGASAALLIGWQVWHRWRIRRAEQAFFAARIRPLGPKQYRHTGHDEKLRRQAEARRQRADQTRSAANKIASGDRPSSKDVLRPAFSRERGA